MKSSEVLAANVRRLRVASGWSKLDLSRKTRPTVTNHSIWRLEANDLKTVSLDQVDALARALNVPPKYLLTNIEQGEEL
ncbi:helix-turn-helix domain-containing protein [Brevibacterium casei]|uniref:Helix-turn-helix domain-containing protein n=1 Tax=Brevibacterium casei CIP 102111 TaxID=1255625 RepID=A0A2H1IXR1_9MICO|nr:helix-turn-helix transcriptional regulator [Brevibacterium casei]MCT1446171.1 helix-turn-helix domain-containing protein [Brevibacterium casei]QPR39550.1 helix-turn-helix domain-containing protein [Brevibacterium casei]QPR43715.1 helix-turn-helix domain-containing protein [Brevibacterium casei]SMX79983.1 Helix-turn-helix domain-containing protein [Brevibacterium casei CIP 102111]